MYIDVYLLCIVGGGNDKSTDEFAHRLLRSLSVLIKMATNPECVHILLHLLTEHINTFIRILQETNNNRCHSQMATFLHNLLQVAINISLYLTTLSLAHM